MERGRRASGSGGGAASLVVALGVVVSLGLTSCALRHGHSLNPGERQSPVSIEVDNQDFNDAVIYTLIGGTRMRLGTVTGEGERHFTIPWTPLAVGMQIHLIGGGTYDTEAVSVQPGDRLKVIVMPGLQSRVLIGHD